jgi:hypothetical protein
MCISGIFVFGNPRAGLIGMSRKFIALSSKRRAAHPLQTA